MMDVWVISRWRLGRKNSVSRMLVLLDNGLEMTSCGVTCLEQTRRLLSSEGREWAEKAKDGRALLSRTCHGRGPCWVVWVCWLPFLLCRQAFTLSVALANLELREAGLLLLPPERWELKLKVCATLLFLGVL